MLGGVGADFEDVGDAVGGRGGEGGGVCVEGPCRSGGDADFVVEAVGVGANWGTG